jgi:site-specific DNA recombinase
MKPVVLYARVSSKDQADHGFSIPAQLDLLREYARKNGFQVERVFEDQETAKQAGRTNFNEMLSFLRKNPSIKTILVEKTDRLYRAITDWSTLDAMDVEIHLVKENEILSKDSKSHQKFIHGIKVLMAKNYCDNLSEEVKKGLNKKAELGDFPGAAPNGYRYNPATKTLEPREPFASNIKQLFAWFATGEYSLRGLSRKARQAGISGSPKGRPYTLMALTRILSNPIYSGVFVWNGVTRKGNHQPLVSKATFDRVQAVFQEKSRPQGIVRNFPFTNLLTCGSPSCQCQITAEIHKGQYVYYRCTKGRGREVCDNDYIRQEQLDALLGGVVRDIQIPAELAQELHKRLKKELGQLETTQASRQQSVELRRARLQANLDKAYEDRLSGAITEEFWKRKSGEWQAELATLHTSPQTLDAKQVMTTAEFALELAQSAHSQYVTRNLAEKRELLQILVSNCTYHRGNLIPTYKKPFDIFAEGWEKQKWRGRRDSNSRPPT